MPPPPSSNLASRLFLGPALRTQSDRRLVKLVHDGYENAFEEIVRRYGKSLVRYAAAIVPFHRADDVTQDAFSKALLALRHSDKEIELRPWLYRIVRNTALNDIRDAPPAAAALTENLDGVETPEQIAERRAEIADLLERLRSLPEPQRAAIVMRELEGLSHEEIAAQLGMTGGAARQTIYRARQALRNGAGFLIPVPALHFLLAPSAGGVAAGAGAGLKAGLATVLVGGTVATGVALEERLEDSTAEGEATARESARQTTGQGLDPRGSLAAGGPVTAGSLSGDSSGPGEGHGGSGGGGDRSGSDSDPDGGSNSGPGSGSEVEEDSSGHSGSGDGDSDSSGSGSSGSGESGSGSSGSGSGSSGSGSGSSGSGSGISGSGSGSSGSGSGSSGSGFDSDSSGSGSGDSGSGSSGSDDPDFELDFD